MSRALITTAALLASVTLVRAEGQATFSPDLKDPPLVAPPAASPPVVAATEQSPARRGKAGRRTRVARAQKFVVPLRPSLADAPVVAVVPSPPARDDAKVAETAQAGNTETASRTPASSPAAPQDGPREEASGTVAQLLAKHAQANGVPLRLAQAVVTIESRGNVRASNHGALGLMQIKYGTARAAGFGGAAMGLLVADTNLRYGMKVLGEAYKASGGDTCGALMRYQSGHLTTHMSAANRAYCTRARALMAGA